MAFMVSAPQSYDHERDEFSNAQAILNELLHLPRLQQLLKQEECHNAAQVYTRIPTIWLLVSQRLGGGLSLNQAVSELLQHQRDLLPKNKRVREGTLSENSSGYSQARQRIPLSVIETFAQSTCDHLASLAPKNFINSRIFIIDGTTITLPPTPELKKAFPPATNQFGTSVWPVAMLLVAHELQTGCAMVPQVAPMYGPNNRSESSMAKDIIDRLPENSVVMADSGFGIFSVAHHCISRGKRFVFRLTQQRFSALVRSATLIEDGDGGSTYHLLWKPSPKDRKSMPELSEDACVEVFLHKVTLPNGEQLYLVCNVEIDAATAAKLYRFRYDVEFDIRDLKVTMDTENIRAKSCDTMMKELLGSVIAFNLVMQFRKQAASLINVQPRQLSFRGVWTTFQDHLLRKELSSYADWKNAFEGALKSASRRRLPNRSKPRNYPRTSHPKRQKTTKFEKSLRKQTAKEDTPETNTG
jgi:hypothetical protein